MPCHAMPYMQASTMADCVPRIATLHTAPWEQVMAIKSRHSGKLRDFKAPGAQYVEG